MDDIKKKFESLPSDVSLLAVSKGQSVQKIRYLASKGQCNFGESRVQEALPKLDALQDLNQITWHFIGKVQANKVRQVVKNFNVIHSIDSLKLASRISRIASEEFKKPKVMIQVKLREDPNKSGLSVEELLSVWKEFKQLTSIDIIGLMTIAPISLKSDERKLLFRECRLFADHLRLKDCSMGMSNDWEEAVEMGATWIRVGSLLFGDRDNHN